MIDLTSNPEAHMGSQQLRDELVVKLSRADIKPNENIGQHFLIDTEALNYLEQSVTTGNSVIEIGAGIGNVTERLSCKAGRVIAFEIDRRYESLLNSITQDNLSIQIIYGDALAYDWSKIVKDEQEQGRNTQIVASLPYHISEPFMHKIAGLPIESSTLVIGQRLADTMNAGVNSGNFSRLSLLAQTFFQIDIQARLGREQFYPEPRALSAIVCLMPKDEIEFAHNRRDYAIRRLFLTSRKNPLVKNCLKEALVEHSQIIQFGTRSKREYHKRVRNVSKVTLRTMALEYNIGNHDQMSEERPKKAREAKREQLTQNQAREIVSGLGISEDILEKPFNQLDNQQIRELVQKLAP